MNIKQTIYIGAFLATGLLSCTKNIADLNTETKAASQVPAGTLFANAVRTLSDELTTPNVNRNVFRLVLHHWATTTYQDEPNYDFSTRAIPQTWWRTMYRDILIDLQEAKRLIGLDASLSDGVRKNQAALVDLMQVYTYSILVNTFGDVPYSEALDYNQLFPKYDDAQTIYNDLIKRLEADLVDLNAGSAAFPAAADFVYNGDTNKWIRWANTLKIRLAMTLADVDPTKAKAMVEAADPKAFTSAADNALVKYFPNSPNNNPIWSDLIQSKRQDFVAGKALVDALQARNDPRMMQFFKPNDAGQYVGGIVGANNTYTLFARPGTKLEDPSLPGVLLSYDELEFYRAEAKERGFAIAGTAAEHYDNAVRASIIYWGGSDAQATAYLTQPSVAYATAPGTYKEKIGVQKWIALYNRAYEGWTEYRRLDAPALPAPAAAKSGFPNRFPYPSNEQTLNKENYTTAAAKMGGDKVETKIFWDKF